MLMVFSYKRFINLWLTYSYCRHEGPVWQLAWSHPMYGGLLASCGYDRKVLIWKESNGAWSQLFEYNNHDSSGTNILPCIKLS